MLSARDTVVWSWPALLFSCALVLASGCATTEFVQLREKPRNPFADRMKTTEFGLIKHSDETEVFLRQTGYAGGEDMKQMIKHARSHRDTGHFFEATHALAELNYLAAEVVRNRDFRAACTIARPSAIEVEIGFST